MPIWNRGAALEKLRFDRRRERTRDSQFSSLIGSPFDLGSAAAGNPLPNPLVLPAGSNIAVSFSVGLTSGQLTLATNTGRTLGIPDLAADEVHALGWFGRAVDFTPTSALAGTVTIYQLDALRRRNVIATGTFT